jgi:hypothetical protein
MFVAFSSDASDLVTGDTNGVRDVFVWDRGMGVVERVSVDSFGTQADGASDFPSMDDSGRYLVFQSAATNLVAAADTNGVNDIYFRDRAVPFTMRISVVPGGGGVQPNGASERPVISGDSVTIAYQSVATNIVAGDTNPFSDVFVFNGVTTVMASRTPGGGFANGASILPAISYDGLSVAFESNATTLIAGDTNGFSDVFLYDRAPFPATLSIVSTVAGGQANGASNNVAVSRSTNPSLDGRYIAFDSSANNLVVGPTSSAREVFVFDRGLAAITQASLSTTGTLPTVDCVRPSIGASPSFLAFQSADDTMITGESTGGDVDGFLRHSAVTTVKSYCVPMTTWDNCHPTMSATGTPSATSSAPFTITTSNLPGLKGGYFFYSLTGPNSLPINNSPGNGMLCVTAPTLRFGEFGIPANPAVGTLFQCNGLASVDFTPQIHVGATVLLPAGTQVWIQTWSRDNGPLAKTFSDALSFVVQP